MTDNRLSNNHILAMSETEVHEFIDKLYTESEKPFAKWRIKRILKDLPHEKSKIKNRYTVKFILNDSNRGMASGNVQCLNAERIYFACGIVIDIETYIHIYKYRQAERQTVRQ